MQKLANANAARLYPFQEKIAIVSPSDINLKL
jgi:hypothetical protein